MAGFPNNLNPTSGINIEKNYLPLNK